MTASTPSRFGAINNGSDKSALFLKVFAGEVMTAFNAGNATFNRHIVRTIASGKSAQFPILGRTSASYFTPGSELLGNLIKSNEKIISINGMLVAHEFLDDLDEAMSHFDVRSHYAREMGSALQTSWDKHVFQTIVQAAQTTTPSVDSEANMVGSIITSANSGTDADTLIAAIFSARQKLDEKNVPQGDRYVAVSPAGYTLLSNSSKVQNVDWGNGGNGSTSTGRVMKVADLEVVMSNNLPTTEITTGVAAGTDARHAVDARNTTALVWQKSAVGTVKLKDLSFRTDYDPRRLGTLMVAKYATGHGVLRPEAAVQIRTATPS